LELKQQNYHEFAAIVNMKRMANVSDVLPRLPCKFQLKWQKFISYSYGSQKSRMKVSSGLSKGFSPWLVNGTFFLCSQIIFPVCKGVVGVATSPSEFLKKV
jgi:hypothetical protein